MLERKSRITQQKLNRNSHIFQNSFQCPHRLELCIMHFPLRCHQCLFSSQLESAMCVKLFVQSHIIAYREQLIFQMLKEKKISKLYLSYLWIREKSLTCTVTSPQKNCHLFKKHCLKAVNDAEQQTVRGKTKDILRPYIIFAEILNIRVEIIILRKITLNSKDSSTHGQWGFLALFSPPWIERNSGLFVPSLCLFFIKQIVTTTKQSVC